MNSFLKKQFLYLFYLTVQCQIAERCSYIIIISKKNEAVIEHREYLIIIYLKKIEIWISNLRITSVYTTYNLPKFLAKSFIASFIPPEKKCSLSVHRPYWCRFSRDKAGWPKCCWTKWCIFFQGYKSWYSFSKICYSLSKF